MLWVLKLLLSRNSTPTRPVENVDITTKGLQDRHNLLLDGWTVENKGDYNKIDFNWLTILQEMFILWFIALN